MGWLWSPSNILHVTPEDPVTPPAHSADHLPAPGVAASLPHFLPVFYFSLAAARATAAARPFLWVARRLVGQGSLLHWMFLYVVQDWNYSVGPRFTSEFFHKLPRQWTVWQCLIFYLARTKLGRPKGKRILGSQILTLGFLTYFINLDQAQLFYVLFFSLRYQNTAQSSKNAKIDQIVISTF